MNRIQTRAIRPRTVTAFRLLLSLLLVVLFWTHLHATSPSVASAEGATTQYTVSMPFLPAAFCPPSQGNTYFVDPNGDDGNPGTREMPFRTIEQGADAARAGDAVYVRGGTYTDPVRIRNSGQPCRPIIVMAYPGESVVIEDLRPPPDTQKSYDPLVQIAGRHVILAGFEVANSIGRGVTVLPEAQHVTLRDLNVHHSWSGGIAIFGNYVTVQDSTIWQNGFSNEIREQYSSHPGALTTVNADRFYFRRNTVYNNHGEGIMTMQDSGYGVIEDNVIYDNAATNLLIDHTHDVIVQRNLIYCTNDPYWWRNVHGPSLGIGISDESQGGRQVTAHGHHQTIVNNIVAACRVNISFRRQLPDGGLKDALIAHNTLIEAQRPGDTLPEGGLMIVDGQHRNTRIENNIILQETGGTVVSAPETPELKFTHNLYWPTAPTSAPSQNAVIADPQLAEPFDWSRYIPGDVSPEWFKITATSPARDAGRFLVEALDDFFGNRRNPAPDIGAHEYGAAPSP